MSEIVTEAAVALQEPTLGEALELSTMDPNGAYIMDEKARPVGVVMTVQRHDYLLACEAVADLDVVRETLEQYYQSEEEAGRDPRGQGAEGPGGPRSEGQGSDENPG